jgi:hypothetical protein
MPKTQRKTFQQILQGEAPRIARQLEMKARIASKLAKMDSVNPAILYAVKNAALQRLFSVPGFNPFIRDAWSTPRGVLLSLKLNRTDSWLHFPFHELNPPAQRFFGAWIAKRARGNPWHGSRTAPPRRAQCPVARGTR